MYASIPSVFVPSHELSFAIERLVRVPLRPFNDTPHPADVQKAVKPLISALAGAAFREVALAARGFEIAHLQFRFKGVVVAISSRIRRDGRVEVEAGLGDATLATSLFTEAEMKAAAETARRRQKERETASNRRW